ncbi:N-formylglutamate amidohydrolase [Sneathiella sp.]|jgi:predicted N-formylglutamate amidohydrolase|uniref:N-formylglutamate amidohydrolase n=1 Tax=Sneathiella sp. TaxID=1964365 RepID=UPI0039E56C91
MSDPFSTTHEESSSPILLIADHASRHIPEAYNLLGIEDPALLRRHVAWDIGIEDVTRRMSDKLEASAIYSGFSRLLIDPNRYPDDPASMPVESDGVRVPANVGLTAVQKAERVAGYFEPYHNKLRQMLDRKVADHKQPIVLSMHSFTPVMNDFERPWHVGILWDQDERLARPLLEIFRKNPTLVVGDNEPYSAKQPFGYTMNEHGTKRDIPHVVIEIRQDLIDTHHGAEQWSSLMVDAVLQLQKRLAVS